MIGHSVLASPSSYCPHNTCSHYLAFRPVALTAFWLFQVREKVLWFFLKPTYRYFIHSADEVTIFLKFAYKPINPMSINCTCKFAWSKRELLSCRIYFISISIIFLVLFSTILLQSLVSFLVTQIWFIGNPLCSAVRLRYRLGSEFAQRCVAARPARRRRLIRHKIRSQKNGRRRIIAT